MNIPLNVSFEKEWEVDHAHTAASLGSGSLDVLSTPMMIAWMEYVSFQCVEPYLQEGYTTVGIHLEVDHLKASPVGAKVRCVAQLTKVEGKRLFFQVQSFDTGGKIGEAVHTRYVVETASFMKKING